MHFFKIKIWTRSEPVDLQTPRSEKMADTFKWPISNSVIRDFSLRFQFVMVK